MRQQLGRRLGRGAAAWGLVVAMLVGGGALPGASAAAAGPQPTPTPTSPGSGSRPPGSATGTDLSIDKRYRGENVLFHPLMLPIVDLRLEFYRELKKADRDEAFNVYHNGAVELINPLGVPAETRERMLKEHAVASPSNAYWRNSVVQLDSVAPFLPRGLAAKLRGDRVTQLLAVSALNLFEQEDAKSKKIIPREHSEAVLQDHLRAYNIPLSARVLGASERQQCAQCAGLYPPDMPTYYAWRFGLSVEETAEQQRQLAAIAKRTDRSSTWRKEEKRQTNARFDEVRGIRAAEAREKLERELNDVKKLDAEHPNSTASAALKLFAPPVDPIGKPCPSTAVQLGFAALRAAGPCDKDAGGSSPADGGTAAATGLGQTLAGGPSTAPGGIDFTTMDLRYLADPGDGSGLQYSFEAGRDPVRGDARTSTGLNAATLSSDAFFVWLSLRPGDFWVNLNPDEPDRIVDARLGSTDAGRVLLQADLRMKKTVGTLIHPDTGSGKDLWNRVKGQCLSFRTWIVPAPASVHQDGDKLYILDAPLDVKMDTQYLKSRGVTSGQNCPHQDAATEEHNEQVYRSLVLPELKRAINTAPDYADLRRVYLARVAAEWYRNLSRTRHTTYGALIDRGDARAWPTKTSWKPTDTFNEFVKSYTKGEFKVTRRTSQGNADYVTTYTYGGVDLTKVPLRDAPAATFAAQVERSLRTSDVSGKDDSIWLGAPTPRQAAGLDAADGALSPTALALRVLPALLGAVGGLLWWRRRRLSAAGSASPLRRAAVSRSRAPSRTRRFR